MNDQQLRQNRSSGRKSNKISSIEKIISRGNPV